MKEGCRVDERAEWRSFEDDKGSKERAGPALNPNPNPNPNAHPHPQPHPHPNPRWTRPVAAPAAAAPPEAPLPAGWKQAKARVRVGAYP